MWNHEMMPHNWGWGVGMGILWLFVLVMLVLAIVWAVRQFGGRELAGGPAGRGQPSGDGESPREILDRRYAEGELSRDEYDQMKEDLEE